MDSVERGEATRILVVGDRGDVAERTAEPLGRAGGQVRLAAPSGKAILVIHRPRERGRVRAHDREEREERDGRAAHGARDDTTPARGSR